MTKLEIEHADMVSTLSKQGADIAEHLVENPELAHLWHMVSCIMGETGELFNTIKKMAIYGQPLDQNKFDNIVEELGDIEFYIEGTRQGMAQLLLRHPIFNDCFGVSRGMTLEANIAKLRVRYGNQYSDAAAKARLDKKGQET